MSELRPEHSDIISQYRDTVANKTANAYMLTIARDGESPARSIYFYGDAVDAATGYAAYTDWGFARDFLTVELYEPTGTVHSKVLRRPKGGECVFHREQYHEASAIIKELANKTDEESYNKLVYEFAKLFSKDNQRFDVDRFLAELSFTGETNDQH